MNGDVLDWARESMNAISYDEPVFQQIIDDEIIDAAAMWALGVLDDRGALGQEDLARARAFLQDGQFGRFDESAREVLDKYN